MSIINKIIPKLKYAVREISENYHDPRWYRMRSHHRINGPVQQWIHGPGHDYYEAEWDTLVILDACRADLFESVINTDRFDEYEQANSGAGATITWMQNQWNETYPDTVYVAGTPILSRYRTDQFHAIRECWRGAISEDLGGPDPSVVTRSALKAHQEFPNKRIVVHYMQPHCPFVQDPDLQFNAFDGTDEWDLEGDESAWTVWEALRDGSVEYDEVWQGYSRNLEFVLDEFDGLVDSIDGRIVISSDHGNMMGEWTYPIPFRAYGHHPWLAQPALTTVPWAVVDGDRREIEAGGLHSESSASTQEIENQMKQLGYLT